MTTIDQAGRLVLDFYRCAMLPLSAGPAETGHADDLSAIGTDRPRRRPTATGTPTPTATRCPARTSIPASRARCSSTGDVVISAPELARLTPQHRGHAS